MALRSVRLQDFRCFEIAAFELDPKITLIQGLNGSGKTSLLEAVFLLGRGRSFRSSRLDTVVRRGQPRVGVSGELESGAVGIPIRVEYFEGETLAWLHGERVNSLTELSTAFPVQVIDPGIHKLIEEGPLRRRRFLDWGVFHVERNYVSAWQRFHRALRQRNAALRQRVSAHDLDAWDEAFASTAEQVDAARTQYLVASRAHLTAACVDLLGFDISVRYTRGWLEGQSLREALARNRAIDTQRRTTSVGPQRADLEIHLSGRAAKDVVSRGQQKLLAAALILGQLELLNSVHGLRSTLLLDDPAAELDAKAIGQFMDRVFRLGAQLVLTSLPGQLSELAQRARVFHVEQGRIGRVL
jgi:DNA replication and repair protein RecF